MLPERLGLTLKSARDIVDATARHARGYMDEDTFSTFLTLAGSETLDSNHPIIYPNVGG